MSFLTFESTRPWAKAMRAAVISRKMPPWGLDPKYGHFANDPSLTQEEIDALSQWAESGALEGDKKDAPPPVEWPQGWKSTPDVVVSLPPMSVPAKGYMEWTDVTIPSPFKKDTWITSMEVRPGVPAVVHHAGVRFAQHRDGVVYNVPVWVDIKRDASGYAIPGEETPQMVTYCKNDSSKLCPAPAGAIVEGGNFEGFYRPGSAPVDYRFYAHSRQHGYRSAVTLLNHWTCGNRRDEDRLYARQERTGTRAQALRVGTSGWHVQSKDLPYSRRGF